MFSPETIRLLSFIILAALVAALFGALLIRQRRSKYTLPQFLFYGYGKLVARILWRSKVSGPLPIADGQGAVIVCNHRGPFDPALIQLTTDRVVHWMVAREYCQHPLFAWFFRIPECIPVGRGGIDTAATKAAIRLAENGDLVGMFPEGRINTSDELLLSGRPGAALVALKARVPVIPCYIEGSVYTPKLYGTMITPAKSRLVVGQPIDLSPYYGREKDREVLETLTLRFMREIAKLAGHEEYQPKLAGKKWLEAEE